MYIPGRSRTGSRPSRTVMSLAVYAVSVIKKALQIAYLRARSSVSETPVVGWSSVGAREARGGRPGDQPAQLVVLDSGGDLGGLRAPLGAARGGLLGTTGRAFAGGFRQRAGCELERARCPRADLLAELREDRLGEAAELECPGRGGGVNEQRSVPRDPRRPGVSR